MRNALTARIAAPLSGWRQIATLPLVGIGIGAVAWRTGGLEWRWTIALAVVAAGALAISLVRDLHHFLLGALILSLQANLSLRFLGSATHSYVGNSGPTSIEFPLCGLIAVALLIVLAFGIRARRVHLTFPSKFILPVVGLVFAASLSALNTPERFITLCYIFRLPIYAVVFAAVVNGIRTEDDLKLVVNLLALTLVIQATVYGIESIAGVTFSLSGDVFAKGAADDVARHGGTVGARPNAFASFILPLLLISLARLLGGMERQSKRALTAVVLLGATTLIGTLTRAAWVGFALGSVFLVATAAPRGLVDRKTLVRLASLLTVPVLALSGLIAIRLAANSEAAYEERTALMSMGLSVFRHYPVIGCGAGAYGYVFRKFLPPGTEQGWLYIVHNRYLLIGAEMGIVGLTAFVFLLVTAFRQALRTARLHTRNRWMSAVAFGCAAGFLGLFWHMFWDMFTGAPNEALFWTLIGTMCAMERIIRADSAEAVLAPAHGLV